MTQYEEHNTEHERITAWQKIILFIEGKVRGTVLYPPYGPADEKIEVRDFSNGCDTYSKKLSWLKKHYDLVGQWKDVMKHIKSYAGNHIDLIFELYNKFPISVNKCACKGQRPSMNFYDVNGMCKKCGLKIKQ